MKRKSQGAYFFDAKIFASSTPANIKAIVFGRKLLRGRSMDSIRFEQGGVLRKDREGK